MEYSKEHDWAYFTARVINVEIAKGMWTDQDLYHCAWLLRNCGAKRHLLETAIRIMKRKPSKAEEAA